MTGKQVLDAIYILKASRSVLAKHIDLRRRQLNVYSKTSSLVKVIKSQKNRFPVTARAVSNLAGLLKSAQGPDQSSRTAPQYTPTHDLRAVKSEDAEGKGISTKARSGRETAQFDAKPGANSTIDPTSGEELGTRRGNAYKSPLHSGSVLSANDKKPSLSRGRDTFSDRSLEESQNNPLADIDRKSDDFLQPASTNRSSIPNPTTYGSSQEPDRARKLQRLAEKQIPSVSADALTPSEIQTTTSNPNSGELDTNTQQDHFFARPAHTSPVLSSLPRVKLPKVTTNTQDGLENLSDTEINQDIFYSAKPSERPVHKAQALPDDGQPSDAMYSEIFQSPRVARLLKDEDIKAGSQEYLGLGKTRNQLPHETDKKSLYSTPTAVPSSTKTVNLVEEKKAANTGHLAEEIANDATPASSGDPEVSFGPLFRRKHILMS